MAATFDAIMNEYAAIKGILISTVEGVVIHQGMKKEVMGTLDFTSTQSKLPVIFNKAVENMGKSSFGPLQVLTSDYGNLTLIMVNALPVVITLIVDDSNELGSILAYAKSLIPIFSPLRNAVDSIDSIGL